jgi:heat shock protein HtpX
LARLIGGALNSNNSDGEQQSQGFGYMMTVMVLEMLFGWLATPIVMWFSRQREYRADAGAAALVGSKNMIAALERLKHNHESRLDGSMMAFGIANKPAKSELFLSHPPLEKRIAALRDSF